MWYGVPVSTVRVYFFNIIIELYDWKAPIEVTSFVIHMSHQNSPSY